MQALMNKKDKISKTAWMLGFFIKTAMMRY